MSGHLPLVVRWFVRVGVIPRAAIMQLETRQAPSAHSVLDAARLAERTYHVLDALSDNVVLLARMGQNLEQFGLKYSHLGFAVRGLRRGEWGVIHLLNASDGRTSGIYQEGLVNFYSDSPYRFESCVFTLPPAVQTRLGELLLRRPRVLHWPVYSLTAYPWSLSTQNSNQWVLEMVAAAAAGMEQPTREQAQRWLRDKGFAPTVLRIPLLTQWAGPLLRDSIRFDDQPVEERRAGRVHTVTVDSVFDFLRAASGPFADAQAHCRLIPLAL